MAGSVRWQAPAHGGGRHRTRSPGVESRRSGWRLALAGAIMWGQQGICRVGRGEACEQQDFALPSCSTTGVACGTSVARDESGGRTGGARSGCSWHAPVCCVFPHSTDLPRRVKSHRRDPAAGRDRRAHRGRSRKCSQRFANRWNGRPRRQAQGRLGLAALARRSRTFASTGGGVQLTRGDWSRMVADSCDPPS